MARRALAVLTLRGDERALDVGCGDGFISRLVAAALPHGAVLGIDPSPWMIQAARSAPAPAVPRAGSPRATCSTWCSRSSSAPGRRPGNRAARSGGGSCSGSSAAVPGPAWSAPPRRPARRRGRAAPSPTSPLPSCIPISNGSRIGSGPGVSRCRPRR
ncbi:class I SAM-dependent methyltransferase [Nakamurella leprariae]|nr:class I SAM-dependent methyltransferase [Nakamurella leprariae]